MHTKWIIVVHSQFIIIHMTTRCLFMYTGLLLLHQSYIISPFWLIQKITTFFWLWSIHQIQYAQQTVLFNSFSTHCSKIQIKTRKHPDEPYFHEVRNGFLFIFWKFSWVHSLKSLRGWCMCVCAYACICERLPMQTVLIKALVRRGQPYSIRSVCLQRCFFSCLCFQYITLCIRLTASH